MIPLIVMLVALILFRGLGAGGVEYFSAWDVALRYALAAMFLFTATAHFTSTKEDLIRMVPKAIPAPQYVVLLTGIAEIVGALGLLIPQTSRIAGGALILLLVAMFPANIRAAQERLTLRGRAATPLWLRLPLQLIYIGLIWWATQPI
ncbi:MAG: hypothetical protein KatS3mg057_1920 [Herpetosiphonaceae bacterium]|nr:MAG: hypothetical protein KatS3mg057_1920 [Herpetosiphonaceae bacterium]